MLAVTKIATNQNTVTDTASVVIALDVVSCPQDHPRVTFLSVSGLLTEVFERYL